MIRFKANPSNRSANMEYNKSIPPQKRLMVQFHSIFKQSITNNQIFYTEH